MTEQEIPQRVIRLFAEGLVKGGADEEGPLKTAEALLTTTVKFVEIAGGHVSWED
jgi:hypothetical protein